MEALISSISTALGWSLLHSLWQGAAIYLILFGLFLTIPELKAATKHNLALTAQIVVFLSFAYTFFNLLDYASLSNSYSTLPLDNKTLFYMDYFQEAGPTVQQYFIYIVPLYLLGILVQSMLCANSYLRIKSLKRLSTFAVPLTWQQRFYDGIVSLGITKNVKLLLSESIYEPLAMGFFKPVIIFPVAYVNKMSLPEVEAILLHELTHIKRNDYLLNMINIVLETILFFNPFIWLMSRHTRTEREQACDDSVMQLLPERTLYAKALLNVELLKQDANSLRMTLAATGTKHKLLHRIKRITQVKMETPYTNIKHQLLASLMVIFTLVSVAWVQPKTNEVAERKATTLTERTNINNELDTTAHVKQETNLECGTNLSAPCTTNTTTGKTIVSQQDTNKINQSLREKFESPEWQAHILKIEEEAKKIEEKFNSREWKAHIAKVEEEAKKIEEKFNSPEWKAHVAKIEENARKIEEKFNSPEWKAHVAKIEENARKIEKKFNSPEWKEKFKKNDQ